MSTQTLQPHVQGRRSHSQVRFVLAAIAIAGTGYIASAFVQEATVARGEAAAATAQPALAVDFDSNDGLPAAAGFAFRPGDAQPRGFDPESTPMPRECNLEKGIATVCLFMD